MNGPWIKDFDPKWTGVKLHSNWTVSNRKTGPLDTLDLDEKTESGRTKGLNVNGLE